MKILMGTTNPGKIQGARQAFEKYFENVEIEGVKVSSEVSDQPINDEIFQGVRNRVKNVKEYAEKNGIEADINAVVIEDKEGYQSLGTSQGFPVPDRYMKEIQETELGAVMDRIFSGKDLAKGKGGISILTKDVVSRIELTQNAFVMALIKHINGDLWR